MEDSGSRDPCLVAWSNPDRLKSVCGGSQGLMLLHLFCHCDLTQAFPNFVTILATPNSAAMGNHEWHLHTIQTKASLPARFWGEGWFHDNKKPLGKLQLQQLPICWTCFSQLYPADNLHHEPCTLSGFSYSLPVRDLLVEFPNNVRVFVCLLSSSCFLTSSSCFPFLDNPNSLGHHDENIPQLFADKPRHQPAKAWTYIWCSLSLVVILLILFVHSSGL